LISLDAHGVHPGIALPIRTVLTYQRATVTVTALAVALVAVAARPILMGSPGWAVAVTGALVTVLAWTVVASTTARVWRKVVESVATDTATTLLITQAGKPCPACPASPPTPPVAPPPQGR
jgi:hypothetical protein